MGVPVLLAGLAAAFPTAAGANDPPRLQQGASGYWVYHLQRDLTDIGYGVPVDGNFGSQTTAEVNAFKRAEGLKQDGVVGSQVWRALHAAVRGEQRIPFQRAHLNSRGLAVAPAAAPVVVKRIIAAANAIAFKPYLYGGGHQSWTSPGYDCSGSVSYALHGGGLLWYPMDSSEFEAYGWGGYGKWITIYTNAGHAYVSIAGLWFDTANQAYGSYGHGDRWSTKRVSSASGFMVRHPVDF